MYVLIMSGWTFWWRYSSKYFIIYCHIDKVHFAMKLTKLTGCIMLIIERNERLCLSNNSLLLYTHVYICYHLSTAP